MNRQTNNQLLPFPIDVPPLESFLYWHSNVDEDPASQWFRARSWRAAEVAVSCYAEALSSCLVRLDHPRHDAVIDGFVGVQPEVALHVDGHLLIRPAGLLRDGARDALTRAQDFLGLNGDVRRRTAGAAGRADES